MNTHNNQIILLDELPGMFGSITIHCDNYAKWMRINSIMQGGIRVCGTALCPHVEGFVRGIKDSNTVLMVGLGVGEAVGEILRAYPLVKMTVVEIDPAVIDLAQRHFPHIQDERIEIVNDDIINYLENNERHWDVVCADAYQSGTQTYLPDNLINLLFSHSPTVIANCLDDAQEIASTFLRLNYFINDKWTSGSNTFLTTKR